MSPAPDTAATAKSLVKDVPGRVEKNPKPAPASDAATDKSAAGRDRLQGNEQRAMSPGVPDARHS